MVMVVRQSDTDGIARCNMSRATPEATGRCHRATTCYVLPQRPLGQQANKQQSTNTPKKVAVLMAMAMRRNRGHRPMEEVQSFTRSHWTLPLGEYYVR